MHKVVYMFLALLSAGSSMLPLEDKERAPSQTANCEPSLMNMSQCPAPIPLSLLRKVHVANTKAVCAVESSTFFTVVKAGKGNA